MVLRGCRNNVVFFEGNGVFLLFRFVSYIFVFDLKFGFLGGRGSRGC